MVTITQYKKALKPVIIATIVIYVVITIVMSLISFDIDAFLHSLIVLVGVFMIYIWVGIFLNKWETLSTYKLNPTTGQYVTWVTDQDGDEENE
jgi:hypothetical protein